MQKENFESLFGEINEIVGEETGALIASKVLDIMTGIESHLLSIDELNEKIEKLSETNEKLIKANAELFGKVGKKPESEKSTTESDEDEDEDEITIEDIVNEKGEIINE